MFRNYLELFKTHETTQTKTAIKARFVQKASLQGCLNNKSIILVSIPVAQITAKTTAIPITIPKNVFNPFPSLNPSLSPITNP